MVSPDESSEGKDGNIYYFRDLPESSRILDIPVKHEGERACVLNPDQGGRVLGYPTVGEGGTIEVPERFDIGGTPLLQIVIPRAGQQVGDMADLPEWQ